MDIVKLEGAALASVLDSFAAALKDKDQIYSLRIALDAGGVKFKINERVWSPPYGTKQ